MVLIENENQMHPTNVCCMETAAQQKIEIKNSDEPLLRPTDYEINQLKSKFVHGLIKIQDTNGIISNQDGNYYMNFKYERNEQVEATNNLSEQLRNVPKFMSTVWNMKSPQIIIPIITGMLANVHIYFI